MKKETAIHILKKYWPLILIVIIMVAGFSIRLLDYRWPYLRNIDSYNFYREIGNIVDNGGVMPGFDPLLLPPDGSGTPGTVGHFAPYQYIAAYSYMAYNAIDPIQLWEFLIAFPALLAAIMAIPMYYIGKFLYNRKAGVLAAFFIVFDISVMSRSLGGDPDSDAIVILLPLIVIALFLLTYKHADKINERVKSLKGFFTEKKLLLYTIITGIVFGIWSQTWAGFWFVLWLLGGFLILKILVSAARNRNIKRSILDLKTIILSFFIILIIFFAMGVHFQGPNFVASSFNGPFKFIDTKGEENREFPNVYVSVAELQNPIDVKQIIQRVTAINFEANPIAVLISPFLLMIYGLLYLMYSYVKRREHLDTLILLLIWFIGPLIATMVAIRFSILFSAPMALGSAIFITYLYESINKVKTGKKDDVTHEYKVEGQSGG